MAPVSHGGIGVPHLLNPKWLDRQASGSMTG